MWCIHMKHTNLGLSASCLFPKGLFSHDIIFLNGRISEAAMILICHLYCWNDSSSLWTWSESKPAERIGERYLLEQFYSLSSVFKNLENISRITQVFIYSISPPYISWRPVFFPCCMLFADITISHGFLHFVLKCGWIQFGKWIQGTNAKILFVQKGFFDNSSKWDR